MSVLFRNTQVTIDASDYIRGSVAKQGVSEHLVFEGYQQRGESNK